MAHGWTPLSHPSQSHPALLSNSCFAGFRISLARHCYATDMDTGVNRLRPYHLSWRGDFGLAQMYEPEDFENLLQLVLRRGCHGLHPYSRSIGVKLLILLSFKIASHICSGFGHFDPRMMTDPDCPGVERLAVVQPPASWLEKDYVPLPSMHPECPGPRKVECKTSRRDDLVSCIVSYLGLLPTCRL